MTHGTDELWNGQPPRRYRFYNFAITPEVSDRDPFWAAKQANQKPDQPHYTDIHMPKNTPLGLYIAGFSFLFGFAVIWHILWLAPVGLLGVIACVIIRVSDDDTGYYLPAVEVAKIEATSKRRRYA